mmetsp:Transcript_1965/g.7096  ORF Transcript_1965/g.7096 Transcript_1965/m.7096 type:complete len:100 (+) Transcript_1965:945-1244(+)
MRGANLHTIQHPGGGPMRIDAAARVARREGSVVHLTSNTEPGSSGSPIFARKGKDAVLVAVHRWETKGCKSNCGVNINAILDWLENGPFAQLCPAASQK